MIHIENIFNQLHYLLDSSSFLLTLFLLGITLKLYILVNLFIHRTIQHSRWPYYFLIGVLIGSLIQDTEWAFMLFKKIFLNDMEMRSFMFWRRISWASATLQYQSLALLLESLTEKKFRLTIRHKFFAFISYAIGLFFVGIAFIDINCLRSSDKTAIEFWVQKFSSIYTYFPLIIISLFLTMWRLHLKKLPRLLHKQLNLLLASVVLPFWLSDAIQISSCVFSFELEWLNTSYTWVSLSNILITITIIYCSRKIMGLRFLNFKNRVQSTVDINFMENFKTTLEQFSHVTNAKELTHITQLFFKEAFGIPFNRTKLIMRNITTYDSRVEEGDTVYTAIETFLTTHTEKICESIKQHKILIYDELAFSNFYEESEEINHILQFLETIEADLFLPIYEKGNLIAYITVDRHARLNEFYNSTEYDEMLIFVNYLANIINLIQNKNLDSLIQQEKSLQEELYSKHQEINQYKESIRSFLRSNKQKDIGIIFYKNRRFTFGNQASKELIKINPNVQEGHPLTKSLKQVAHHVEAYKVAHTVYAKDNEGTKLILAGVPSLEQNNVIISIYYPEVSDVIKKQIDILKDPSEWDYLLYLETTKPGQLINQLIPGSGEILLNFKIELLKTALTKKATLLNIADQDLQAMVELLHHISLRETLQVLELDHPSTNYDIAIKLFGISTIYGIKTENAPPLLEKLDNIGTLFIKNIHFLDLETQKYLAEFIRYGMFRIFKSDQKITSNVRMICSTNQNLAQLVREGTFSQTLFNELKHTTLEMPSLITLPEKELNTLADGFSEQAVSDQTYKNFLSLSDKDKNKLINQRPTSLVELKTQIQQILIKKSKKNDIYHETQFDPAYEISDPELAEAARLGKYALKDRKTMTMLWNKFKNQNKIASFLGVNRSSVNRRCKQFNLQ